MKFFCTGLFVLLSIFEISAQKKSVVYTATIDSSKISMLSLGVNYGNTANYYGQTTAEKLPYGSFSASYSHKNGLWASASVLKLINTGSGISETDLSAGYDFDITQRLGASLSYTRFIFSKDSPLPQSVNPNAASASLLYNWKWLNTALHGDYVFGNVKDNNGNKQRDFFLTFNASKEIDLGSLFSENDYVTITPSVQCIGGTQVVGHYDTTKVAGRGGDFPIGGILSKNEKRSNTILPRKPTEEITYVESSSFNLLNTSLKLPVAYNRNHYTIEAAYQFSIPNKNSDLIINKNQSYFTLSFFYLFFKD